MNAWFVLFMIFTVYNWWLENVIESIFSWISGNEIFAWAIQFSLFFHFFVIFKIPKYSKIFYFFLIILTSTILHVSTSNNPPALNEISTKFSYSIWSLSSTFPSIRLVGSLITCALDCFLLLWTFLIRTKSAQLSWWCWGSGKVNSLNNKCFSIFFFFCFYRINCYFMHMRRNNPSHLPWVLSTAHVLILNLCELS